VGFCLVMGASWLPMLALHLLYALAQNPYQNSQQGAYLSPQYISPQFLPSSPQVWATDRSRLTPSIFDLDLKSLGSGLPSTSRTLAPLTNIDTASNAIFPLTDITAEPTQTAKNSEQTISIYQDTLTKMYREVTAQKESIKKSDELIQKLQQVQANNKKILDKNMATVKKYSAGLVTIVTQYTESLDMAGSGSSSAEGGKSKGGKADKADKADKAGKTEKGDASKEGSEEDAAGAPSAAATKSFMEQLAQLKKHAVIGLTI